MSKPKRPKKRKGISTTSVHYITKTQLRMLVAIAAGRTRIETMEPILLARNTVGLPAVQRRKFVAMLAGLITRGYVRELPGGEVTLTPKGRAELG